MSPSLCPSAYMPFSISARFCLYSTGVMSFLSSRSFKLRNLSSADCEGADGAKFAGGIVSANFSVLAFACSHRGERARPWAHIPFGKKMPPGASFVIVERRKGYLLKNDETKVSSRLYEQSIRSQKVPCLIFHSHASLASWYMSKIA